VLEELRADPNYKVSFAVVGALRDAGDLVEQARLDAGLSMNDLARALGCGVAKVQLIESGALRANTSVLQLAEALAHCGKRLKLSVEGIE